MTNKNNKKRYDVNSTGIKKRDLEKYPALNKSLNLRTRQDLIDFDYLDKLTPKELEWLNKFNDEYVNTSFDRQDDTKNLHPPGEHVPVERELLKKGKFVDDGEKLKRTTIVTSTKTYKSESDNKNYLRKKDVYTGEKAANNLKYLSDYKGDQLVDNHYEDKLIYKLDNESNEDEII